MTGGCLAPTDPTREPAHAGTDWAPLKDSPSLRTTRGAPIPPRSPASRLPALPALRPLRLKTPAPFAPMNFFRALLPRPNRRATLLELHRRGVVQIFRRHSLFRLWEPLREHPARTDPFAD